jgi:predicted RNA binding protein YcfA (HicA-like mRNA interferase family)
MANSSSEIKKALKKYGWTLLRTGSKHFIYSKGNHNIIIPFGDKVYSRNFKQILLQIKGKTCNRQKPNDVYSL